MPPLFLQDVKDKRAERRIRRARIFFITILQISIDISF
jgi:hypothetical protein